MMIEVMAENILSPRIVASALSISILCAVVGTIVVEKNIVMMSGGIAHMVFGGVGLGVFLGWEPIWGALVFAVAGSVAVVLMKKRNSGHIDGTVGVLWALGMALGSIFIYLSPGEPVDIHEYLFGDIEAVNLVDLYPACILAVVALTFTWAFFNHLKAYLFDEPFTYASGSGNAFLDYCVYILIGVSVVALLRVAGIILAIALLTIPPMISRRFASSFKGTMMLSAVLGITFSLAGMVFAYGVSLPAGASIILVASMCFFASFLAGNA